MAGHNDLAAFLIGLAEHLHNFMDTDEFARAPEAVQAAFREWWRGLMAVGGRVCDGERPELVATLAASCPKINAELAQAELQVMAALALWRTEWTLDLALQFARAAQER
jgi:hypothetical protein